MDNVPILYRLLRDLGIRSTKTVWPLGGTRPPSGPTGTTCDDPSYLAWVKELARDGFEIGLHNVTYHSSHRDEVKRGLDRFRELFGTTRARTRITPSARTASTGGRRASPACAGPSIS